MSGRYTIRYRNSVAEGTIALIVEDERGRACLFREGWLQRRIRGEQACAKLAGLLGGNDHWDAVPHVAPYPLAGLRALVGGAASFPQSDASRATAVRPTVLGHVQALPDLGDAPHTQ